MSDSIFSVKASIKSSALREEILARAWVDFEQQLQGVVEGQVRSEEAHAMGFETEAFPLDSALAPRGRDWVASADQLVCEFYFGSLSDAELFKQWLLNQYSLQDVEIETVQDQDWNAVWKAHFSGAEVGIFRIVPAWKQDEIKSESPSQVTLILEPGFGFGTGTHESTQLCLTMLSQMYQETGKDLHGKHVLDFGSGSGVLSIAAIHCGAESAALVEIDPLANENALHNASLNSCSSQITTYLDLDEVGPEQTFDLVFANVLRPVLLEYSERLLERLRKKHGSSLLLSGCIQTDQDAILDAFVRPEHKTLCKEVFYQGEWLGFWIEYVGH